MENRVLTPIQFKCPHCDYQTRKEVTDIHCPECGEEMLDMRKSRFVAEYNWYKNAFNTFPCVIAHEYERLFELSEKNDIYGVFLQIKDVIESTIKFVVLVACAWGKSKEIDGTRESYEAALTTPTPSLGHWKKWINDIRNFYEGKQKEHLANALPDSLWNIVESIGKWIENSGLLTWRNDEYAHGAVAYAENEDFQKKTLGVISKISRYFEKNKENFEKIAIESNGIKLVGYNSARGLQTEVGECYACIDHERFSLAPFVVHINHGIYFFDELLRNSVCSKMLCYPTGDAKYPKYEYFIELREFSRQLSSRKEKILQEDISNQYRGVTRKEIDYINKLSINRRYFEPKYITNWLEDFITRHKKGVFLLSMERGCGKTFYAEKLNSRYSDSQSIYNKNLGSTVEIRTFHLSCCQYGGLRQFIKGIETEWKLALNKEDEIIDSPYHISEPNSDKNENARSLAQFLNQWKNETKRIREKDSVMLVLDGLDEIVSSDIWSYIPTSDMLDDGVYVLLTSRNPEVDNLSKTTVKNLAALQLTEKKVFGLKSPENKQWLVRYAKQQQIPDLSDNDISKLIAMSESRMLSFSMLCEQTKISGLQDLSVRGMKAITKLYLDHICKVYGNKRVNTLIRLLVILAYIGCYEPLSLGEIADLLMMGSIRLELLDMITDIMPILISDRGFDSENGKEDGDNRFQINNGDVLVAVREFVQTYAKLEIDVIGRTIFEDINSNDDQCYPSAGNMCYLAYANDIEVDLENRPIYNTQTIRNLYIYCLRLPVNDVGNGVLLRRKSLVWKTIVDASKKLSDDDLLSLKGVIYPICNDLYKQYEYQYHYTDAISLMEYYNTLLEKFDRNNLELKIDCFLELAEMYKRTGSPKEKQCLLSAEELINKKGKKELPQYALVLTKLGTCYTASHDLYRAEKYYNEAKKYYETIIANSTEYEEEYETLLSEMAYLYGITGRTDNQLEINRALYNKGVRRLKNTFDINTFIRTTKAGDELALALENQGEFEDAKNIYLQIFANSEILKEVNALQLYAQISHNFGKVLRDLHFYDEAIIQYKNALEIYCQYSKRDNVAYLKDIYDEYNNLANAYSDKGMISEAKVSYENAIEICKKLYGSNKGRYRLMHGRTYFNYARFMLFKLGDLVNSKQYYLDAMTDFEYLHKVSRENVREQLQGLYSEYAYLLQLTDSKYSRRAIEYYGKFFLLANIPSQNANNKEFLDALFDSKTRDLFLPVSELCEEKGWKKEAIIEIEQSLSKNIEIPDPSEKEKREDIKKSTGYRNYKSSYEILVQSSPMQKRVKELYSNLIKQIISVKLWVFWMPFSLDKAVSYKKTKEYDKFILEIAQGIKKTKELSTVIVRVLFNVLIECGDFSDAFDLVAQIANLVKCKKIEYDRFCETIDVCYTLMVACVEGINDYSIYDFLCFMLKTDDIKQIQKIPIDIPIKSGMYMEQIKMIEKNFPGRIEIELKSKLGMPKQWDSL